jgi:hypothetical protein
MNIGEITKQLLLEAEELEILYHENAFECFKFVFNYENEFGGIPTNSYEEYISQEGTEEQREVVEYIEYCNADTYDYFFKIADLCQDYREKKKSLEDTLLFISETEHTETSINFYDFGIMKAKQKLLSRVVELNKLSDKPISKVEEIAVMQAKRIITVKEFAEIYSISKTSQQNYRARLHDPLPHHQKVEGGKITYVVDEVEKWFENQHK